MTSIPPPVNPPQPISRVEARDLLDQVVVETGVDLRRTSAEVVEYTALRAAHLADISGEPGWAEAVAAERDNVMLFAAENAIRVADRWDERVRGIVHVVLMAWARVPPVV